MTTITNMFSWTWIVSNRDPMKTLRTLGMATTFAEAPLSARCTSGAAVTGDRGVLRQKMAF